MKTISAIFIFLVILTLPILISAANGDILAAQTRPELEKAVDQDPDTGNCVKDVEWMRANHMNLLKTERENAVRDGVRTQDHSLKNCFTCHKHKDKFCDQCHNYAGVNPGCFSNVGGCHYAP